MIEKLKTILSVHRKENVECPSSCFCWDIDTFIFFFPSTSEKDCECDTYPLCPVCLVEKHLTIKNKYVCLNETCKATDLIKPGSPSLIAKKANDS